MLEYNATYFCDIKKLKSIHHYSKVCSILKLYKFINTIVQRVGSLGGGTLFFPTHKSVIYTVYTNLWVNVIITKSQRKQTTIDLRFFGQIFVYIYIWCSAEAFFSFWISLRFIFKRQFSHSSVLAFSTLAVLFSYSYSDNLLLLSYSLDSCRFCST